MPKSQAKTITDHDEIRRWAEERDATPACVRGTGGDGDVGMLRLDFPGYGGEGKLEHISWEEWFRKFDERGLALLIQNKTAAGQKSNFNKLVSRETGTRRSRSARTKRAAAGARRGKPAKRAASSRASRKSSKSAKSTRGSTRAKRTQSVRGRTPSRRRAA